MESVPTNYPGGLTDSQWEQIKGFFPQGPNSAHHKRGLINAVLYLVDNGCKRRALPHDFPPYPTVHAFYRRTRISGAWEKVPDIMAGSAASSQTQWATYWPQWSTPPISMTQSPEPSLQGKLLGNIPASGSPVPMLAIASHPGKQCGTDWALALISPGKLSHMGGKSFHGDGQWDAPFPG